MDRIYNGNSQSIFYITKILIIFVCNCYGTS